MTNPALNAYEFHVSVNLSAHADITVVAASEEEARAKVAEQLDQRDSYVTSDLAQSASIQIRKELGAEEFEVDLEDVREPDEDDLDE